MLFLRLIQLDDPRRMRAATRFPTEFPGLRARSDADPRCGARANPLRRAHGAHVALALIALTFGCEQNATSAADARAAVDRLVALFQPVDPTKTSDVHDRNFRERTQLLDQLRKAGRGTGLAAFAAFQQSTAEPLDVRWALLEIAAYNAPEEARPALEQLISTYDGEQGLGLRTQAVRILAEALPERALEVLEPLIREPRAHKTMPPMDELVRGWATAAKKLGRREARVLCDVVVDLRHPPEARYAATTALGDIGGERAIKALREVLVEGASDGNIRRKAAQQLLRIMPRKEFCALIDELAQHESDPVFIQFLADMLDKNCAGQ
jgi:hypothetical protein